MPELAHGIILRLGNGAETEVFTAVAQIKDVAGPKISRDTKETTHHDSTDGWKEFAPGLKDGGEVTWKVNLIKATVDNMLTELATDEASNWQVIYPYTSSTGKRNVWNFAGILTGLEASEDTILEADLTIKVTGKPTFTEITWPET